MRDVLLLRTLGLLPKNLLSRAVGAAAHLPLPRAVAQLSIRTYARLYGIDLEEAERPTADYAHLGDFFVRRLRTGARPIDRRPGVVVSPADGRLLNSGRIADGKLIQCKGRMYDIGGLLRDEADALRFRDGSWLTVYLSPRDYHRVHHPVEGRVVASRHVPGHLWPVNRAAVQNIDRLFCVNERLVTYVESPVGEVAVVMVGATSVGHITVTYDEALRTNRGRQEINRRYDPPIRVARGDELGAFHLGSTVIVLFADPTVELEPIEAEAPLRMGQAVARRPRQK